MSVPANISQAVAANAAAVAQLVQGEDGRKVLGVVQFLTFSALASLSISIFSLQHLAARLAQLVRSQTANQKVPGSILGLFEG